MSENLFKLIHLFINTIKDDVGLIHKHLYIVTSLCCNLAFYVNLSSSAGSLLPCLEIRAVTHNDIL